MNRPGIEEAKLKGRGRGMPKIIVIYYSRTGTTRRMAELIAEGIKKEKVKAVVKDVSILSVDELLDYSGIIIGSPVYYGSMSAEVKRFIDASVKLHGKLDGKVAAAFSSSANIGGGNESTVLDILHAMLIHGMIIYGDPLGDHYGPVAVLKCDSRVKKECLRLGSRVAVMVKKLKL